MREYYSIPPQFFDYSYRYLPYKNLKKRIESFKKKHFSASAFTYWSMHGWGHGECIRKIFLYKENDVFYEFFSGYKIGSEINKDGTSYIIGETLEPILLFPIQSHICPLTPSQFASDVEYHMKEKRQLARIMKEYFELQHQLRLAKEQIRVKNDAQKAARDNHNADWLEKHLDKR